MERVNNNKKWLEKSSSINKTRTIALPQIFSQNPLKIRDRNRKTSVFSSVARGRNCLVLYCAMAAPQRLLLCTGNMRASLHTTRHCIHCIHYVLYLLNVWRRMRLTRPFAYKADSALSSGGEPFYRRTFGSSGAWGVFVYSVCFVSKGNFEWFAIFGVVLQLFCVESLVCLTYSWEMGCFFVSRKCFLYYCFIILYAFGVDYLNVFGVVFERE